MAGAEGAFLKGTRVAPGLVAERADLEPETPRYARTVRYLVREGALVWEEHLGGVPGLDIYRVTRRGLQMLRTSWLGTSFLTAGGRASMHVRYAPNVVIISVATCSSRRAEKPSPAASAYE